MERDYYKRTGIYPIMHLVAIKKDIYERYPFVATSLYDAFVEVQEDRAASTCSTCARSAT